MSVITKTPFRISLVGGGSDYLDHMEKFGYGKVVGFTFDKYSYVHYKNILPIYPYKSRIALKEIDLVTSNKEIKNSLTRGVLGNSNEYFEVSHVSDLPGGTGTGSSSAYLTGLVKAVNPNLKDLNLFKKVVELEQDVIKERVGLQDSAFACLGGFCAFTFNHKRQIRVSRFIHDSQAKKLVNHVLLFYIGGPRVASVIASSYQYIEQHHKDLQTLTRCAMLAIRNENYHTLGRLILNSWEIKKSLSSFTTNDLIDDCMETGIRHGCWGGKLIGAGGGGCAIFLCPTDKQKNVIEAQERNGFSHIPIKYEPRGCHVIG